MSGKERRRKPVDKRLTFEFEGEARRLSWLAENEPVFLIKQIIPHAFNPEISAIFSALARAGWDRGRIQQYAEEHSDEIDPGVLQQV